MIPMSNYSGYSQSFPKSFQKFHEIASRGMYLRESEFTLDRDNLPGTEAPHSRIVRVIYFLRNPVRRPRIEGPYRRGLSMDQPLMETFVA